MKLFYEQARRLQILPHAIFCTFTSYSPLFCAAFLFSSNAPALYSLTLSSLRPSAVFHFFCRRFPSHFSPASATGFLCLFSCFPAVEKSQNNVSENIKTYIYKNKFISLFSYLSTQIFFYYNLHLLI